MSYDNRYCPFLNRNDSRCAERFQVSHLQFAFQHCFEQYKSCPTYLELLVERRVRQGTMAHGQTATNLVPVTICGKAMSR